MIKRVECGFCLTPVSTYQLYRCNKLKLPVLCPDCEAKGYHPVRLSVLDDIEKFNSDYQYWLEGMFGDKK
jgi:hypothetical protein